MFVFPREQSLQAPTFDGRLLRAQRKHAGITKEALAREIGRTLYSINRFENNEKAPSSLILGRLAHALDCSVATFFTRAETAGDNDAPAA